MADQRDVGLAAGVAWPPVSWTRAAGGNILGFCCLLIAACGAPSAKSPDSPSPPPAIHADGGPRLRAYNERLYIENAPEGAIRGELLYVLARDPLPSSDVHPRIGIVKATQREGSILEVVWYCRPPDIGNVDVNVPIETIPEDTYVRVGHCVAAYSPANESTSAIPPDWVDLRLAVGSGDGVKAGDRYAILGKPLVDETNRRVTDFQRSAICLVQADELQALSSVCRVDLGAKSTQPDLEPYKRGGFVLFDGSGSQ